MYDVIVVGAGTGGTLAAKTAAQLGLKVCLVDSKPASGIGDKVCGEGIEERDFTDLGITPPKGDELANYFKILNFYSPNKRYHVSVRDPGYVINRYPFGQRLLKEALDAGAELYDQIYVSEPIITNGFITGIAAHKIDTHEPIEFTSKIVIDASGTLSALRRRFQSSYGETVITKDQLLVCYREILKIDAMDYDPNQMHLFFSNTITPGGYSWLFPKQPDIVNLGLGVSGDNVHNLKEKFKRNVLPLVKEPTTPIHQGGGMVSVRYPLWSLVDNGLMFIGDAGFQANPIHGGGIGSSMRAGIYAAEEGAKAIEMGDYSVDQLWSYNQRFAKQVGAASVALSMMRFLLYRSSDNDLNTIFKYRLFTWEDFTGIVFGKFRNILQFHPLDTLGRVLRGHNYLRILNALVVANDMMNRVYKLYLAYPLRADFEPWKKGIIKLYNYIDSFTKRL
jgi:geranylgeranyl reductase family protein